MEYRSIYEGKMKLPEDNRRYVNMLGSRAEVRVSNGLPRGLGHWQQ